MSLFSLDVLEPSLIKRPQPQQIPLQTISTTPTEVSSEASSSPSKAKKRYDEPGPPRWNTPEFWFYGFMFAVVCPTMAWTAYDLSKGCFPIPSLLTELASKPNYAKYANLLSDGWIPGRKVVCRSSMT